jgi:hypothetical protein
MKVVILNKKEFILPRVEREKFIRLMRLGLEYNRDKGTFSIKNLENINEAIDTISDILNDEAIFLQQCLICNKDFPCSDCKYGEFCETKNLPFECICPQCLIGKKRPQKTLF